MSYPLDERGEARKTVWIEKFLHDTANPPADDRHPADRVLDPMLDNYGTFWNERIAPFFAELYAVTGLEPKTVELIATALLALRGWETGVRAHTRLALDSGATPEEIRGAILVTLGVGGITSAASGLAWAEAIFEEMNGA
jgi:AhpD family alkylhydroperoxidase